MRVRFEYRVVRLALFGSMALALARRGGAVEILSQSPEFQVNTYTPLNQTTPAVAADGQGRFVVVWEQLYAAGGPDNIVARRFDSAGSGLGPDFQVNVFTPGTQRAPAVGRSGGGGFVVVWASNGQDGDAYGVFGRRYDSAGTALATEFQINTYTPAAQSNPRLAMGSGGDFVVVWQSSGQDGDDFGIFGRRFDASGAVLGVEFQANTYGTSIQVGPNVARRSDGAFVVSWNSGGQDGDQSGVFARRFTSGGSPIGGELQINAYTVGSQQAASLTFEAGGFAAVWQSQDQDGSGFGIFARGFDEEGVAEDEGELQINVVTADNQFQPVIQRLDRGFVVVWFSNLEDGDSYAVVGRPIGEDFGEQVLLNTTTPFAQRQPRVAATGQRFVVVWQSANQDGANNGIFGRRFVVPITLDVDGDGSVLPLTDSLLILRYTFGFRGNTLISGAVGANCSRCDAPSIEAYLANV